MFGFHLREYTKTELNKIKKNNCNFVQTFAENIKTVNDVIETNKIKDIKYVIHSSFLINISQKFNKQSYTIIKCIEEIKEVAADRADILLEVSHQRSKLSQATQLLEQDLNKKPDYRWLYAILITLIIMGVCIYAYTSRKRRQHKLLSQEVDDIRQEKESLQEIHNLIVQEHNDYTGTLITQIQQNCIILRQSEDFPNNIYWKEFNTMSKIINDNFGLLVQKLHKIYHLQEKEIRLCILVLFDTFNSKQQAKLLFYSESGIRNFKNHVAKKLGTNSTELRDFLINLAINEHSKCI